MCGLVKEHACGLNVFLAGIQVFSPFRKQPCCILFAVRERAPIEAPDALAVKRQLA